MTTAVQETFAPSKTPTPGIWELDPTHATVGFVSRHLGLAKVRGHFERVDATIELGETLADSSVEATIDASSITTGVDFRDNHLRSADLLDVEKFPTLRFRSTGFEQLGEGEYAVTGELTVRDVTKPVVLDVEFFGELPDPQTGGRRSGFSATTEINREDFGITWNGAIEVGGFVGKKVKIEIEAEALLKQSI